MNKNLIEAIAGTLLPVVVAIVCGYLAWVSYLWFYGSFQNLVWNWADFNSMVAFLFLSGLFVGVFASIISAANRMSSDAKKEQEKQNLKEEIKKELEMEKQKKEGTA